MRKGFHFIKEKTKKKNIGGVNGKGFESIENCKQVNRSNKFNY